MHQNLNKEEILYLNNIFKMRLKSIKDKYIIKFKTNFFFILRILMPNINIDLLSMTLFLKTMNEQQKL